MLTRFILFVFIFCQTVVQAQNPSQKDVIDQINLGVKYLTENKHVQSIEELVAAKEVALKNKWYSQVYSATVNIGTNYFLMLDYGEAFQQYLEGYEVAIHHLGPKQEMAVVNNIGVLYTEEKDMVQAEESFFKAYNIAKNMPDGEEQAAVYAINLALALNKTGHLDRAEEYIDESLPLLKNKPNVLLLGKIAKVENLFLRNQLDQAEILGLSIVPQSSNLNYADESATINDQITLYMLLGKIYQKKSLYDEALKYAHLARVAQSHLEGRPDIYNLLSEIYGKQENYSKALNYKDSVVLATDSLFAIRNYAQFKSEKVKYQIRNYQHQLWRSQLAMQKEKEFFYILIGGLVALMGFLIWIYKNNATKQKQQKRIVELELEKEKNDHLLKEKEHLEKEAIVLREKEHLKNAVDAKNQELIAKAIYLTSQNEHLEKVIETITSIKEISSNLLLKKQINELKDCLKQDEQWENYINHFEELNQDFLNVLRSKHPNLTSHDVRFLCFLYMNLSFKEIASLLNITVQSCRKRKERISKKIDLPDRLPITTYLATLMDPVTH